MCPHSSLRCSVGPIHLSSNVTTANTINKTFPNDHSSMLSAATIVSPMDIEEQLDDEQCAMSKSISDAAYDNKNPLCNGPVSNITGPTHQKPCAGGK